MDRTSVIWDFGLFSLTGGEEGLRWSCVVNREARATEAGFTNKGMWVGRRQLTFQVKM